MKKSISELEAIGLALAAFTLWVFTDTTIKLVGQSGQPPWQVIAFLGFWMAGFLLLHGLFRGTARNLLPHDVPRQFVRALLDLGNNFGVVIALRHLTLPLFYILIFLAPLAVTLESAWLLGERLEARKVAAIVCGFAGVVVAVDPFGHARQGDGIGYAACALCVACFSLSIVMSRRLTQTESPESLTFVSGVLMAIVGFGMMLWRFSPMSLRVTGALCAMGFFCALGSWCFFQAVKHAPAATVSQYHYTQLPVGAVVAWFIWHNKPTVWMAVGGAIIVAAGLYVAIGGRSVTPDPELHA
ncbi:MAG TPA: DMT family transporter [Acidobacteriaceae bacterium]|nr:DMT family transporter [Acidobacteriaceae bacterium]